MGSSEHESAPFRRRNVLQGIQQFISEGGDPNAVFDHGETLLHATATTGSAEAVALLLSHGAEANARDAGGKTPLHRLIPFLTGQMRMPFVDEEGAERVVPFRAYKVVFNVLVANGADLNLGDECGDTPLHEAARACCLDVVQLTITHGANVNVKNDAGRTPLHYVSSYDIERDLALSGIVIEEDSDAAATRIAILELLIANGANVNMRDSNGDTPLGVATVSEVISVLKKHGAIAAG